MYITIINGLDLMTWQLKQKAQLKLNNTLGSQNEMVADQIIRILHRILATNIVLKEMGIAQDVCAISVT